MSKAAAKAAPPVEVPPPEPVKDPLAGVDPEEAWRRFAPFVFTVDSDTKDTVDLKGTLDIVARDPSLSVGTNMFILDRAEVLQWFSALEPVSHAAGVAQQIQEAKAQLPTLMEGGGDNNLVALAFKTKIRHLAMLREATRMEELEVERQRHDELVERLMEEGLTKREAEAAAKEEEAAAKQQEIEAIAAANGGTAEEVLLSQRPLAYIFLKGFPLTTDQVNALQKVGVGLHAAFTVNCKARFGRREEPVVVDPKAKGKKPEPKKAEVKKVAGKKGGEEVPTAPVESVGTLLGRELAKNKFDKHPWQSILLWTHEVSSAPSTKQLDESALQQAGAGFDLLESEGEVAERLTLKIITSEQMLLNFQLWQSTKQLKSVPMLVLPSDGGSTNRTMRPTTSDKPEPPAAELAKKPVPPPKKGAKGKQEESAPTELLPPPPPPPPPLPPTVEELPVMNELYRRLIDEISTANASIPVQLHCLLEQIQESLASSAAGDLRVSASTAVTETVAAKNRKDVSDFTDFVLAHLDGSEESVFEACRRRRLKAAEVLEKESGSQGSESAAMQNNPLHVDSLVRLNPNTQSTTDPGALLLGLPLGAIEARICQAAYKSTVGTIGASIVVKTDFPQIETHEDAQHLVSQLLREKCGTSVTEAIQAVESRTLVEVLSARQLGERLSEVMLFSSTTKVVEAQCLDGARAIVLLHPFPTDRKRWRTTWHPLHGVLTFPKWLEWTEHVAKEDLYFNPPPKTDDDEEELPPPEEPEEEEEEEEEEAEESPARGDDDDLDLELDDVPKPKKLKKKKEVHYDPEYVDFEAKATEEQRRRATMEHLRNLLNEGAPVAGKPAPNKYQSILAKNHSSTVVYEEESVMFPDDGSTITTIVNYTNTNGVNCTVDNGHGLLFGFRSSNRTKDRDGNVASGVSAMISLRNEATCFIECELETDSSDGSLPPSPKGQAPAATPAHGAQPAAGLPPLAPIPPIASTTAPLASSLAKSTSSPSAAAAVAGAGPTPSISTSIHLSTKGTTVSVDTKRGSVYFEMGKAARDCPLTVYQPTTQQVIRIFTAETSRRVLPNGVVLSTFADGTKMNIFPNGNTSVLHKGYWMITNAQGRRVLKNAETGKVTPLVMSLVTTNTDVETQSKVTTREDGVVTVHYDDGRMLVQHIEGTRMWQDANRTIVEVETEGLPVVACAASPLPGADHHGGQLLCVKWLSGLYLSVRPEKRVTIGHFHMGFAAAVELEEYNIRMVPSTEFDNTYLIDYALGGLRTVDHSHAYNVTPKGRTRSRALSEEMTPVILDPTVKQIIDVFGTLELVSPNFSKILQASGFDIETQSVHRMSPQDLTTHITGKGVQSDVTGFAPPPRSRQMKDKERACVNKLKALIPEKETGLSLNLPPHIFIMQPSGQAYELMRKPDVKDYVKGAVAHSDLLYSDVYRGAFSPPPPSAPAANPIPPGATTPPAADSETGNAFHVIASVSAIKPQVRPGIPKIILDIRSGSSAAPMSVAHFLQELRQGPAHSATAHQDSNVGLDGLTVACSLRHFLSFPPIPNVKRPLVKVTPGSDVYSKAAESLAKAIPPVIAAQISVQRTAAILAASRDIQSNQRHSTRHGSRESKEGTRNMPKRRGKSPRSTEGKPGSAPQVDEEFAHQMEELKKKELLKRKPWPNPVQELKQELEGLRNRAGGIQYWADEDAAVKEEVVKANERYKAKNGYSPQRVDAKTASPRRFRPAGEEVDVPPMEAQPQPTKPKEGSSKKLPTPEAQGSTQPPVEAEHGGQLVEQNELTSSRNRSLKEPRLVATPTELNFGILMEGFRYSSNIQLTNISVRACRFRVYPSPSCSGWLSVSTQKPPIAAGMSAIIEVEIEGSQPVGVSEGSIIVEFEGSTLAIEVHVNTRSGSERPVPHPKGVRMIGPVKMNYKPGSSVKLYSHDRKKGPVSMENKNYADGNDSD